MRQLGTVAVAWAISAAACTPAATPTAQPPAPHSAPRPAPTPAASALPTAVATAAPTPPEPSTVEKTPCTESTGLALALVLDRSGSMTGTPMEMAKRAAKAAAQKVRSEDYVDVIAFDSAPKRVAQSTPGQQRTALLTAITAVQPGGGTEFLSALDMAYQDLTAVSACRKHILFLSDGMAPTHGVRDLVSTAVSQGVMVSTVGLGSDVDEQLLKMMSDMGGGRYYPVSDPTNLPTVFAGAVDELEKEVDRSR